jgi:uncharacterized membrane protein
LTAYRSQRIWWVVAVLMVVAAIVLLSSIARRQAPAGPSTELAAGESEGLRAQVVEVLEEGVTGPSGLEQPYQRLKLRLEGQPQPGQEVVVDHGLLGLTGQGRTFQSGDRVLVEHTRTLDGLDVYAITDYVRTRPMVWIAVLFVAATLLFSGWQGIRSLAGMAISVVVIVAFIVPQILAGQNPVAIALLGSVVMMGASLYLVYGWQPKTHVAVAGLLLSLAVTGLLARASVEWTRLSGYGAEEAAYLQTAGIQLDLRGLLLAGILIGVLGALDDVAIGQASAIVELSRANPELRWQALFRHGMNIGRDHIAAMVNTLLLAYMGAALPLVLLFSVTAEPLGLTLNREIVAEEIVRTLVGSLGLLVGVPATSLLGALVFGRRATSQAKHVSG